MNDWTRICRIDEIPLRGARCLPRAAGADVALFRTGAGEVFALLDRCPHKGGPLSQGIVSGRGVACSLHNWTIALDDGCAHAPDHGCTPRFAVKVEHGEVFLDASELHNVAIDQEDATPL